MLLGIYDDLLMACGGAVRTRYKLLLTGAPITPGGYPPFMQTSDLSAFSTATLPWTGVASALAVGNEKVVVTGSEINATWFNGQNALAVSKDNGATFTRVNHPQQGRQSSFSGGSVAFGRGLFVLATPDLTGFYTLYTSPDGVTWTQRAAPFVGSAAVAFVNGVFFVYGYDTVNGIAAFATSQDGVSFARRPDIWPATSFQSNLRGGNPAYFGVAPVSSVNYANGYWILGSHPANGNVEIAYSNDLANWTRQALPWGSSINLTQANAGVSGVSYFKGAYYAIGYSAVAPYRQLATSADLKSWSLVAIAGMNNGGPGPLFNLGDRMVTILSPGYPNAAIVDQASGTPYYTPAGVNYEAYFTTDGQNFAQFSLPAGFWSIFSAMAV